ncbi:homogentisate 1,2-dioxygenase [Kutzneria sp. CA-103260]|uniref:homogentisate 1,2-dioxygenase n=1 Tax=Kutzneria sp. CA-103260 TaxID=2802641 RepID=UPI001BA6BDE3|nr:homogentisate 1,2-dioxygenase [Kutzneria sp. CA-103260]QUQ68801.1 homogentisate 1,2-dioxygenase [Kutzneria sp. CA-103260]
MSYYRAVGELPPKRHTQFRQPDGTLYYEELMGLGGFADDSALLYHENPPMSILRSERVDGPTAISRPNHPLLPRHYRTRQLDGTGADAVLGRQALLANTDVRVSYFAADQPSSLYRNAIGDECVFLASGSATLETVFGRLSVRSGDYVVIPAATTHRWVPDAGEPLRALVIEALGSGHIHPPSRYLSPRGQFLEHAPYCERDLRSPDEPLTVADEPADILVRTRNGWTQLTHGHHPFDVVGWDGGNYPYALNIREFEPITGRIHQPPPVHQVLEAPGAVICAFVPRKFDYHPLSIPAPYSHANVDSDEVLFYVDGEFNSRKGSSIEAGSISLHPSGFIHGPHPGAVEASLGKERTEEYALMLDTFQPLELCASADRCEDESYAWSWARHRAGSTS